MVYLKKSSQNIRKNRLKVNVSADTVAPTIIYLKIQIIGLMNYLEWQRLIVK